MFGGYGSLLPDSFYERVALTLKALVAEAASICPDILPD